MQEWATWESWGQDVTDRLGGSGKRQGAAAPEVEAQY